MNIQEDLNNRRIRQLIEQFNAEEAYDAELRSALEELRKLIANNVDLAGLIAALRKARWKLRERPPVDAIGVCVESLPLGQ